MWPLGAAAASGRLGPDLGLVLEDQPLDDPGSHRLVLRIEGGDGLESQLQIVVRAVLALIEHQGVDGNVQGDGQLAQGLQRGLGQPRLIALDLRLVDRRRSRWNSDNPLIC